jgi:hypothetical protein
MSDLYGKTYTLGPLSRWRLFMDSYGTTVLDQRESMHSSGK